MASGLFITANVFTSLATAQRRLTECIKSSAGQYRDIARVIMELDNFPVKQLTNPFETINK